jgi:eukaryotic-like serine/threonine-protein kinase
MTEKKAVAEVGAKIAPGLTVLGHIDIGGDEPVYIVWNHVAWCPMACKVMRSARRARDEAAVLKAMAHPYIVRLLDVVPPGLLLMPFLEGQRLCDVIDEHKSQKKHLAISDCLRIAIHVGSALSHVHAKGYLHLDIKPDNVMISPGGRPILFDFGTARSVLAKRPDTVCGTNAYIAPEECALSDVGPAADIFSLGVMLYEMLTGALPFGKRDVGGTFPQLIKEPAAMRSQRASISAELENLVFACLSRNPEFRPPLSEILPHMNRLITRGPRMWPDTFQPERTIRKVKVTTLSRRSLRSCPRNAEHA